MVLHSQSLIFWFICNYLGSTYAPISATGSIKFRGSSARGKSLVHDGLQCALQLRPVEGCDRSHAAYQCLDI